MIYLYTGTPGSGKSLRATREIILYLEKGRNVISNYPVALSKKAKKKGGRFYYWDYSQITPDALMSFARTNHKRIYGREEKAQTLLVIDESQIMFNSREFRSADRLSWISFFSKHRHLFYEIILIAQNDRMLDRQIRSLAEYEIKHRNATNFGKIGFFIKMFRIRLFVAVHYYCGVNQKVGAYWFVLTRKDKRAYDSYLDFDKQDSEPAKSDDKTLSDEATAAPAERPAAITDTGGQGGPVSGLAARLSRVWRFMNQPIRLSSVLRRKR